MTKEYPVAALAARSHGVGVGGAEGGGRLSQEAICPDASVRQLPGWTGGREDWSRGT